MKAKYLTRIAALSFVLLFTCRTNLTQQEHVKIKAESMQLGAGVSLVLNDTDPTPVIEIKQVEVETVAIAPMNVGYVNCHVNIHKYPNIYADVISVALINSEIEYEKYDDEWSKIKYGEVTGYIHSEFISSEMTYHLCDKSYEPSEFKRKGEVNYGSYRYTWYSQRVLPGKGLKIPGRYVDEDGFVCDENGYICLASGMHKKGTILDTPVGRQGIVYDFCETDNTVDIYVNW